MSIVTPSSPSNGGKIKLRYAPGGTEGISDKMAMKITLDINPSTIVPKVEVSLELPDGHFEFGNRSKVLSRPAEKQNDGDEITVNFEIICSITNPSNTLVVNIFTCDKEEGSGQRRSTTVQYAVETVKSTAKFVKARFESIK